MKPLSITVLLLTTGLATAQDMPLHEITKPGESWQAHAGAMPARVPGRYHIDLKDRPIKTWWTKDGTDEVVSHAFKEPVCGVVALNGSTILVADAADRYIWAIQIEKNGGIMGPGDRYCRLRVRGDDRRTKSTSPDSYRADPSAMTVDGAGRTYVATNLGIQVFDPTGRLCGVFSAPPGRTNELAFDGDRLFALADGKAYVRQMLAAGTR